MQDWIYLYIATILCMLQTATSIQLSLHSGEIYTDGCSV